MEEEIMDITDLVEEANNNSLALVNWEIWDISLQIMEEDLLELQMILD